MNPSSPHAPDGPADSQPLLAVACPTCFGAVAVGEELFGGPADCPLCGGGFHVPRPTVSASPQRPSGQTPVAPAARRSADAATGRRTTWDAPPTEAQATAAATSAAVSATPAAQDSSDEPAPEPAEPSDAVGGGYRFREPVLTVGSGDDVVALRRLSPEEKSRRRTRRTLVIMLVGVSILLSIVLTLGRKRQKRRQP